MGWFKKAITQREDGGGRLAHSTEDKQGNTTDLVVYYPPGTWPVTGYDPSKVIDGQAKLLPEKSDSEIVPIMPDDQGAADIGEEKTSHGRWFNWGKK